MLGSARVQRFLGALGAVDGIARLRARASGQAGHALVSTLDQAAVSGFNFLTGIIVARTVDIGSFGRFALVMIAVTLAQSVHNALITAPMMTIVGRRRGQSQSYFASLLVYAALLSLGGGLLVAAFIGGLFAARGDAASPEFVAAAGCVAAAQNLQFTLRRLLFARTAGAGALRMDLSRAGLFVLAAAAWHYGRGTTTVEELLWILAATAVATSLPALRHHLRAVRRGLHLGTVTRRHVPLSRWLLPVVLLTFGQEQAVWIIAGVMLGDTAMGGLRASQYLVGLVLLFLSSTENVIPVAAARALTGGGERGLHRYLGSAAAAIGLSDRRRHPGHGGGGAMAPPPGLRPGLRPLCGLPPRAGLHGTARPDAGPRRPPVPRHGADGRDLRRLRVQPRRVAGAGLSAPDPSRARRRRAAQSLCGHAASLAYLVYTVAAERRSRRWTYPPGTSRPVAAGRE